MFVKTMGKVGVGLAVGVICVVVNAWDTGVLSRSTHKLIVERGKNAMSPQDAELNTYQARLYDGCNSENHENDKAHNGNNWGTEGMQTWWNEAVNAYKSSLANILKGDLAVAAQNKSEAYFKLGCMMHLICDLGVPAHSTHVGHGFGYGFFHPDQFEMLANSNWKPDYKSSSESDPYFGGSGDPGYSNPCDYYSLSQHWTLYDLTNEPSDTGKGWFKKYYTPPSNPYDNSGKNFGHYVKYQDEFDWTWAGFTNFNLKCCTLMSKRENRTSYVAKWTLKSACAAFKKLQTEAGVSSELMDSFLEYKRLQNLVKKHMRGAAPPPNDNFADAIELQGASGQATGSNDGATLESNEPSYNRTQDSGNSVWWKWTAPSTAIYGFDTKGSDFDTALVIYKGESLEMLGVEASDNNASTDYDSSYCWLSATQGVTYYVAILGAACDTDYGNIVLNYYPEENITWDGASEEKESENELCTIPALNGAIASTSGSAILRTRYGTTQKGFHIMINDNYDYSGVLLTIMDAKGNKLVDGIRPEGVAANEEFKILDFNGRLLLIGAYDPSLFANNIATLGEISMKRSLFRVAKSGLTICGTATVDHFQKASLNGGDVEVVQYYATGDGELHMMMKNMDSNLDQDQALDTLASGFSIVEDYGNNVVSCMYEDEDKIEVQYQKMKNKEPKLLVDHIMNKTSGENLRVHPDKAMGLLYWKEIGGVNGVVSYINSKKELVLDGATLEGAGASWNCLFFDGKNLYVDTQGDYSSITHYVLSRHKLQKKGSVSCSNYYGFNFDSGNIYLMEYNEEDNTGGVTCYDKDFKHTKFQVKSISGTPEFVDNQTVSFTSQLEDGTCSVTLYKKGKLLNTQNYK